MTLLEQILAICDSGEINMLDAYGVQAIASRERYYDLVCFIEDDRTAYTRFIMRGDESILDEWKAKEE